MREVNMATFTENDGNAKIVPENRQLMNNVRCVPLTAEDLKPYSSIAVARLYLRHLYVGKLIHGILPSPRIEEGALIFRLGPVIRYQHQRYLPNDPKDPGESLLRYDDRPIKGSREEHFQRFAHRNPEKYLWDEQPVETLSIPLGNSWVVVFSRRERDISEVMRILEAEAQLTG